MSQNSMTMGAIIAMVSIMPEEHVVSILEKGLKEYKEAMLLNPSESDKKKILDGALAMPCMLIMLKTIGDNRAELIKRFSELDRVHNLIHPNLG